MLDNYFDIPCSLELVVSCSSGDIKYCEEKNCQTQNERGQVSGKSDLSENPRNTMHHIKCRNKNSLAFCHHHSRGLVNIARSSILEYWRCVSLAEPTLLRWKEWCVRIAHAAWLKWNFPLVCISFSTVYLCSSNHSMVLQLLKTCCWSGRWFLQSCTDLRHIRIPNMYYIRCCEHTPQKKKNSQRTKR